MKVTIYNVAVAAQLLIFPEVGKPKAANRTKFIQQHNSLDPHHGARGMKQLAFRRLVRSLLIFIVTRLFVSTCSVFKGASFHNMKVDINDTVQQAVANRATLLAWEQARGHEHFVPIRRRARGSSKVDSQLFGLSPASLLEN